MLNLRSAKARTERRFAIASSTDILPAVTGFGSEISTVRFEEMAGRPHPKAIAAMASADSQAIVFPCDAVIALTLPWLGCRWVSERGADVLSQMHTSPGCPRQAYQQVACCGEAKE